MRLTGSLNFFSKKVLTPPLRSLQRAAMGSGSKGLEQALWEDVRPKARKRREISRADARLRKQAKSAEPGKCYTLHEIAKAMGVTRERVRQIQQKALKKLHKRLGQIFRNEDITPEDAMGMVRNVNSGGLEHAVVEKEK